MPKNQITKKELDELCQYVCSQISFTGSRDDDRETVYFALYWQLCVLFEQRVEINSYSGESKIKIFRQQMQNLLESQKEEISNFLQIIDGIITRILDKKYKLVVSEWNKLPLQNLAAA